VFSDLGEAVKPPNTGSEADEEFEMAAVPWSGVDKADIRKFWSVEGLPTCEDGLFRFGRSCRLCSTARCPIGQYRMTCDADRDGYCATCTNKKGGEGAVFTTPGNSPESCAFSKCSDETDACPVESAGRVYLSFYVEMPIKASTFWANKLEYMQAVAAAAGVQTFDVLVDDVTIVNWGDRLDEEASVRRGLFGARRSRRAQRAPEETEAARPGGHDLASDDRMHVRATGQPCDAPRPENEDYLEIVTDVATTGAKLQALFEALSEWRLNVELAQRCLPPATVKNAIPLRTIIGPKDRPTVGS
jgi:hypothetical protein